MVSIIYLSAVVYILVLWVVRLVEMEVEMFASRWPHHCPIYPSHLTTLTIGAETFESARCWDVGPRRINQTRDVGSEVLKKWKS